MKKLVVIIIIIIIGTTGAWAQPPQSGRPMERIHAAKMAYITDRLHLSEQQMGGFIPLYNEYEQEVKNTRMSYFQKYRGVRPDQADDATAKQAVDDNLDYQQQVIDIKRRYNDRFLRVISPQQLSDLYKAEREFKQMLMQRLKQHGGDHGGGDRGGGRYNRDNGGGYYH